MSALSLAPRALYEEVAELLRQRIFRRELEPGAWIDEMRLAEEYGISRTPLREALKVSDRVVVMSPRPGRIAEVIDITTPRPRRLDDMSRPEVGEVLGHIRHHFSPTGALG